MSIVFWGKIGLENNPPAKYNKYITITYVKENVKMTVDKNSIIGEVLDFDKDAAKYFFEIGMHCLGCPHARSESIEQACAAHGADCDELLAKLNAHFGN